MTKIKKLNINYKDLAAKLSKSYQLRDRRKFDSSYIGQLYYDIHMNKQAVKTFACQDNMVMADSLNHKQQVVLKAMRCHSRMCPDDQAVLAKKNDAKLGTILRYLSHKMTKAGNPKYHLIQITVTIPNAVPLPSTAAYAQKYLQNIVRRFINSHLLKGWGKDHHGRLCHGRFLGVNVKFEQTVNPDTAMLNIHAHLYCLVHGSYFHSRYYIPVKQYKNLYDKVTGHNYDLKVQSAYYKDKNGKKHYSHKFLPKIIKEATKYQTKSQDFININKRWHHGSFAIDKDGHVHHDPKDKHPLDIDKKTYQFRYNLLKMLIGKYHLYAVLNGRYTITPNNVYDITRVYNDFLCGYNPNHNSSKPILLLGMLLVRVLQFMNRNNIYVKPKILLGKIFVNFDPIGFCEGIYNRVDVQVFDALARGYIGVKHFINYGMFRKLISQYRHGYKKFNKYKGKDNSIYATKLDAKWRKTGKHSAHYKYTNKGGFTDKEKIQLRARGMKTLPLKNKTDNAVAPTLVNEYQNYMKQRINSYKNRLHIGYLASLKLDRAELNFDKKHDIKKVLDTGSNFKKFRLK